MNHNPYQPPAAASPPTFGAVPLDAQPLATRGSRLGAAFIDGVIGLILSIPLHVAFGTFDGFPNTQQLSLLETIGLGAAGYVLFALVHFAWLKNGQTIGKKLLGIRMVDNDSGRVADVARLLLWRYLPVTIVSLIPFIGGILALIDVLFIFRGDRRCLHDLIANTRVISGEAAS